MPPCGDYEVGGVTHTRQRHVSLVLPTHIRGPLPRPPSVTVPRSVTFDNRPPVYFAGFDGSTCDGVFSVQGNSEFASRPDCLHKARLVHTKGEDKFVNEAYARAAPDLLRYECDVHALDAFLQ